MRSLQRLAIGRPVATAMFYLGVVLLGVLALSDLEVNLLPNLELPRITVVTAYENAAPEEIENLVTKPLAEAASSVGGLDKVTSESLEGVSFVTLQFSWGTNVDFAVMEVREKLDLVRGVLPEDAGRSIISRFDPSADPFMEVVFFANSLPNDKDLRHFLESEVKVYLDRVDGVAQVEFSGGYKKEIQVEVDAPLMNGYGLSLNEIGGAMAASNLNSPAGSITVGDKDVLIRTLGEFQNIDDIRQAVVGKNEQGVPVRLGDLADVRDGYEERTGLALYNGRECVVVSLRKEAGKNTVQVAADARKEIEVVRETFGDEVDLAVVYDESRFVRQSIWNIAQALIIGGLLAFLILVLILRNLRSPVILLTVLPISVLATFLLMYTQGISLNLMSLGGMALGIGMLFDAGNVVLSSIERYSREGLARKEAALRGAGDVSGSISAAVFTTVTVFLPIVFLQSVVGVVFAEMALTITYSLLVSLAVSLTLIPMLSSLRWPAFFQKDLSKYPVVRTAAAFEDRLERRYERRLAGILDNPRGFIFTVLALLTVAWLIFPFVQREFLPRVDTGEFSVEVENVRGASLESTRSLAEEVEAALREHPDVEHAITFAGYDPDQLLSRRGGDVGTHRAQVRVVLRRNRSGTAREVADEIRRGMKLRDDVEVSFGVSGDVLSEILSPDAKAVMLEVAGDDLTMLTEVGGRVREHLGEIEGVVDVQSSMQDRSREYHVRYDDLRLAVANMSREYLSRYLRTAIDGSVVTRLRVGDEEIDIRVQLREEDRNSLEGLGELRVKSEVGENVPISQIIKVKNEEGYTSILRNGPTRINRITADLAEGADRNAVYGSIADYVDGLRLPEGYSVSFGGERENLGRAFQELVFAFLLAAVLVYMILAAQFESIRYPVYMLLAIPLIVIGVFPALYLTSSSLNVSSFTGVILLIGIVVDNAALFYEYVHILREEGKELREAIQESGKIVLRPVIMNNSTTLLGLLPVALQLGEGTEFQAPMAIAVISGLIASVFLSLFVIPTVFYYVMRSRSGPTFGSAPKQRPFATTTGGVPEVEAEAL